MRPHIPTPRLQQQPGWKRSRCLLGSSLAPQRIANGRSSRSATLGIDVIGVGEAAVSDTLSPRFASCSSRTASRIFDNIAPFGGTSRALGGDTYMGAKGRSLPACEDTWSSKVVALPATRHWTAFHSKQRRCAVTLMTLRQYWCWIALVIAGQSLFTKDRSRALFYLILAVAITVSGCSDGDANGGSGTNQVCDLCDSESVAMNFDGCFDPCAQGCATESVRCFDSCVEECGGGPQCRESCSDQCLSRQFDCRSACEDTCNGCGTGMACAPCVEDCEVCFEPSRCAPESGTACEDGFYLDSLLCTVAEIEE